MGVISPAQISDGTTMDGADVNNPINTIANEFNGNIDNNNIKTGAAIATAKLASDAGITDAMITASTITGTKLAGTYRLTRQNDTANVTEATAKIYTGWGVITPGVAAVASETVTFPAAFTSAPIVILTSGGDNASLTTYGSGGANVKDTIVGEAISVTTTQFTARLQARDNTNWAAGNTVFYQWFAIGI